MHSDNAHIIEYKQDLWMNKEYTRQWNRQVTRRWNHYNICRWNRYNTCRWKRHVKCRWNRSTKNTSYPKTKTADTDTTQIAVGSKWNQCDGNHTPWMGGICYGSSIRFWINSNSFGSKILFILEYFNFDDFQSINDYL